MSVRSAWLLPGGTDSPGQTREDTRLAPLGTMAPESEIRTRAGVIAGGDPFAATGAGAMDLQIGVGRAVVQGTDAQGAYPITLDAPQVLTFGDGDAQFARTDTVCIHVYDALFDTSGQTLAAVEIIVGEATETADAPLVPPGFLALWDVKISAGASAGVGGIDWTSALTDRRVYTAAYGGIIPRGSSTDVGAYDGQYRDMAGVLERWNADVGDWETYRAPLLVENVTAGFTIASGYTLTTYDASRFGGAHGIGTVVLQVQRKAQLDAGTGGNIADEAIGTVPPGWRPWRDMELAVSDGFGGGTARLSTTGALTLRTWSTGGSLIPDRTLRFTSTYALA
ncbi:hypothetical protein [Streptomyces sp. 8L]|uniref:hypothetical protein n=1 Tax=Streptomyces sp. 8L TaxID=2877242 RepID=UPI001CD4241D|nr:hypothetical protein [Streptomyces sp. 8L]MCA1219885.1 hypothetical protein [Streptomyces sp. 8L]